MKGNDADDYAQDHLIEIKKDLTTWTSEYICPTTRIHWIEDRPYSVRHGGGPTRLRKLITSDGLDEFSETRIRSYLRHRNAGTKMDCQCRHLNELAGDSAEDYSWNHLTLLKLDYENWTTDLMCPKTAIRWQMKWVNDLENGQGIYLLRKIPKNYKETTSTPGQETGANEGGVLNVCRLRNIDPSTLAFIFVIVINFCKTLFPYWITIISIDITIYFLIAWKITIEPQKAWDNVFGDRRKLLRLFLGLLIQFLLIFIFYSHTSVWIIFLTLFLVVIIYFLSHGLQPPYYSKLVHLLNNRR